MSHIEEIPCFEVLSSVVFIVEGAMEDARNPQAIASHLDSCLACRSEVTHEQEMHSLLQDVLRRTCDEKAPVDLQQSIHEALLRQVSGVGVTEVVTQFSMTEISIEIDEFGNVEHSEIQIEQTHVQHFLDEEK
jgi:glycosylphosphatidylinositol transamidase (GPIT) subunit GPI8